MPIDNSQLGRANMIGTIHRDEKRVTDTKDHDDSKNLYLCRCIGFRLGDQFTNDGNIRILERRRNETFNKRSRVEDEILIALQYHAQKFEDSTILMLPKRRTKKWYKLSEPRFIFRYYKPNFTFPFPLDLSS
jgi:hypothetical protein